MFAELQGRGPLLQGKNEMEQLNIIYRLLGAPHEGVWPGVGLLPLVANNVVDLRKECEKFPYNELKDSCPRICDVSSNGYISILLVSYFLLSGELDSSALQLPYHLISPAFHITKIY